MSEYRYHVEGLDCPDCAASLARSVERVEGIRAAKLDYALAELRVETEADSAPPPALLELVTGMGYRLSAVDDAASQDEDDVSFWRRLPREHGFTLGGAALLLIGVLLLLFGAPRLWSAVAFSLAAVVAGIPVARAGWLGLRYGHALDMNALMTIAGVGALVVGEYAEGAITMVLFSVGELLEGYTAQRARDSVRSLMALAPLRALRIDAHGEEDVAVEALAVGDRIRVRPGERIAADGVIVAGASEIDQASVTGESMPVTKGEGDDVYAATLNGQGVLTVEVRRAAQDSTLQRIKRLIEEAQAQRAPMQRFVDRFARVYTPLVVVLATLIALLPPLLGFGSLAEWGYRALVMLVIACPCALVISTPVTLVSALARAAKEGVLIKGGNHLETLARLDAVAFDKTGTLSEGRPRVLGVGCDRSTGDARCEHCELLLAKAAAVEAHSEHSLGQAIREHAQAVGVWQPGISGEAVRAVTGRGIVGQVDGHAVSVGSRRLNAGGAPELEEAVARAEADGHTVLLVEDVCCDARCYIALSDQLRPEASEALQALRRLGVERLVMLTGDNAQVARRQSEELGLDDYRAELLPEDKVAAVQELMATHGTVAMVGDGVNDAPALARASVGIAMGAAGTDVALETADVALMGDDLTALPFAVGLAKRTLAILRANIGFALLLKVVFLALAATGHASLWLAVLADTGAALAVSLNGLRLLRHPRTT